MTAKRLPSGPSGDTWTHLPIVMLKMISTSSMVEQLVLGNLSIDNTHLWDSDYKESTCNIGDVGWIFGLGRSHGKGNGNPLWYSCLENPVDRGAWWATVHRVTVHRVTKLYVTERLTGPFTFFASRQNAKNN